ncbi:MAG TPA: VIT1/CCC1 transporter family protein [Soehngenia sp.]|nr:VIT1/CCC1 transporter family protein [Soehngenia sp.]
MKELDFFDTVKKMQSDELMEREVYLRLLSSIKNEHDKDVLKTIADEEAGHYEIWKEYTKVDVKPNMHKVRWYVLLGKLLGYTFTAKIMEKRLNEFNQMATKEFIDELREKVPDIDIILKEEDEHEMELLAMIDEERLQYVGSIVLGLNDALVEFTGSLAGWTFAMQNNRLILLAGLIAGISATLSMASSEYLSTKNEGGKDALKSASYTGIAYLITVLMLLIPYAVLPDKSYTIALVIMIILVVGIIAAFNYYISIAKDLSFKHKFREMASVSLGVAAVSFLIGLVVKQFLGLDI